MLIEKLDTPKLWAMGYEPKPYQPVCLLARFTQASKLSLAVVLVKSRCLLCDQSLFVRSMTVQDVDLP